MKVNVLILCASISAVYARDKPTLHHANYLFNALHSAMRQWGSSLHHNGLTAFIAHVPADTEFYHGTGLEDRINGTEWLAFEPEHALLFPNQRRGPPPGGKPGKRPPRGDLPPPRGRPMRSALLRADKSPCPPGRPCRSGEDSTGAAQDQITIGEHAVGDEIPQASKHGYLHTYRAKHSLRLLYVDGQSAAKSDKGTLDMQDVVLLHGNLSRPDDDPASGARGPMFEHERALGLCDMAGNQWKGRIDGILRMEGGFEIILCSFEKHLDVVSIKQVEDQKPEMLTDDPNIAPPPQSSHSMFHYYKAIAARYDGIGGDRVKLEFDRFVSLFTYRGATYIDEHGLPRAKNGTNSLEEAREAIDDMALDTSSASSTNWQAVADMVVDRYSARIELLTSVKMQSITKVKEELKHALRPFIDYSDRNHSREIDRCAQQFLPKQVMKSYNDASSISLAGAAIRNVSTTICQELSRASRMHTLDDINATILQLRNWLNWTSWKRCNGCNVDEFCFVPIWPSGSLKDFQSPTCRSGLSRDRGDDNYWQD